MLTYQFVAHSSMWDKPPVEAGALLNSSVWLNPDRMWTVCIPKEVGTRDLVCRGENFQT